MVFSSLNAEAMIFKYRGTTIRLFSTKLFILVMVGIGAVIAVLTLHEIIAFDPSGNIDPPLHNNGFYLNRPQINALVTTSIENAIKTEARNENININVPQESLRVTTKRPTIKISLNKSVEPEIQKLRHFVKNMNDEQYIRNGDKFGTTLSPSSIVIIIQVHDRSDYFSHLLNSMRRSRGIEDALLIVSHDYHSEEMNKLVESIDFCRVMQIFFPFSYQLYPNEFPGTDPKDCPRDISREKAKEMGCINAETPDMYGHYRQAPFTMIKHHWWWKANTVFDMLNVTKDYAGPVLFLEEDYYVSPDFYHMLKLLYNSKMSGCKEDCDLITLGTYRAVDNYELNGAKDVAALSVWRSHEHNMGMAFDRVTWNKIKKCSDVFCKSYDEYNWDWSLMKISVSCLPQPFKSLILKGPRVFHLGECGLHHKKTDCKIDATVQKFQTIIEKNTNSLFPPSVNIQEGDHNLASKFSPNGGWGDTRDHALCFQLMQKR